MSHPPPAVVVLGSINLDIVCEVMRLPAPGETLEARAVRENVGGKGANQAVAAARVGASVTLVARIGSDDAGHRMRAELGERGLDMSLVRVVDGVRSGTAFITVDALGENTIVIDAGANAAWAEGLAHDASALRDAELVVLQHEVPAEVVREAAQLTTGRLVLNAAPARAVAADVLARCDPLVVNESELTLVSGQADVDAGLATLLARGAPSVVVTLGSSGARWVSGPTSVDGEGRGEVGAPSVPVVDTTGAGDAFVGVLATRLTDGAGLADAVRWGVAAASLSVGIAGTHAAFPNRETVAHAT